MNYTPQEMRYLELMRNQYGTIRAASAEVAHLQAVQQLPKGTEHFLSDLHGEHNAFLHMLHNASGVIKMKIQDLYGYILPKHEQDLLATLIYYPNEKLALLKKQGQVDEEWYRLIIYRLIEVARRCAVKYTRKRIQAAMPKDLGPLIEEMLFSDGSPEQEGYYQGAIQSILDTGLADAIIISLSEMIQTLAIDRLHIIGDIFDRGPRADLILDALESFHQVDVQWGNHDIVWMGAAALSQACIWQVIVTSLKYSNLKSLEVGYGISLRPLLALANQYYQDDPCIGFMPKDTGDLDGEDAMDVARMHKAAAIIQFKLEGQLIERHPEYHMDDRRLLHHIDFDHGTIQIGNTEYPLKSCIFPTFDKEKPYQLNEAEQDIVDRMTMEFAHSARLQRHVQFLYSAGSMYLCCNGNLLYHGCIPLERDGSFAEIPIESGKSGRGKAGIDLADKMARQGFFARLGSNERLTGQDFLWYLGCGPNSPLFGKDRMATFERYFIENSETHTEHKNKYYELQDDKDTAIRILKEFGMPESGFIINGHVPVKVRKGESPIKAGGKLLVIDGGMSRAYQPVTGIAGYTLIFNSHELNLVAHQPFVSKAIAISDEQDIHSRHSVVKKMEKRLLIRDTDEGAEIEGRINDLMRLIEAYRSGELKELRG